MRNAHRACCAEAWHGVAYLSPAPMPCRASVDVCGCWYSQHKGLQVHVFDRVMCTHCHSTLKSGLLLFEPLGTTLMCLLQVMVGGFKACAFLSMWSQFDRKTATGQPLCQHSPSLPQLSAVWPQAARPCTLPCMMGQSCCALASVVHHDQWLSAMHDALLYSWCTAYFCSIPWMAPQ